MPSCPSSPYGDFLRYIIGISFTPGQSYRNGMRHGLGEQSCWQYPPCRGTSPRLALSPGTRVNPSRSRHYPTKLCSVPLLPATGLRYRGSIRGTGSGSTATCYGHRRCRGGRGYNQRGISGVWRQADTFKAKSRVSTWILGVARYKALSALRRRPKEPSMSARRTWSPIPPRIRRRWRSARSKG